MLKFLPAGFIGLMVGGLIAANSSTILTHLNWGASYLVHDFYRRFLKADATEAHYVRVGRFATVGLFLCSAGAVYLIDTAKDTFDIILQIGAGTGLLYLVRWFWWRVNAWCEIVAMTSSLAVSIALLVLKKNGVEFSTHAALLTTVAVTTVCWLAAAYLAPATDRRVLAAFYQKVRPFGPGWASVRRELGLPGARCRRGRTDSAGAHGLGGRLRDDLVVALHDRQHSLRPYQRGARTRRRRGRERPRAAVGRAAALGYLHERMTAASHSS